MTILEIKDLEFPLWKDVKKDLWNWKGYQWRNYQIVCSSYSDCVVIEVQCGNDWSFKSCYVEVQFKHTKQGYADACKWLNDRRIQLIRELI